MSRVAIRVVALLIVACLIGCQSEPFRAFKGARYYASGSRALESGNSKRAILELSEAAFFVPHASEVQNHLGLAFWADGQEIEARLAFERAIELDCDNESARNNLARLREFQESGLNAGAVAGDSVEGTSIPAAPLREGQEARDEEGRS